MRRIRSMLSSSAAAHLVQAGVVSLGTVLVLLPLAASALPTLPTPSPTRVHAGADGASVPGIAGIRVDRVVAPRGFFGTLAGALTPVSARTPDAVRELSGTRRGPHGAQLHAVLIPSFARQTKLPCSACHYQFPVLTPFGRLFKLNGYTLSGLPSIVTGDTTGRETLSLAPIPPASAMVIVSTTHLAKAQGGTQNNTTEFPQQASLFFAGQVAPKVGAFTQFTYTQESATIDIDNVDLRFATHLVLGSRDLLAGITLHNNPTVQDVWNTVPAWGYPFVSSSIAPSPAASTLIDGVLAQEVLGLGVYSLFDNTLYAEASAYRSAPQGSSGALDTSATNVTNGVIPYWRVALQHQWPTTYVMVGTYGLSARLYPSGVSGTTNTFTDIALDAQAEHAMGRAMLIGRATYIHERRSLDAFVGESPPAAALTHENLSTTRANVSLLPGQRSAFTVGYFQTTGTADALLFPEGDFTGSRTGSPNTSGATGEATYNAWQNVRVSAQYVWYRRFNGARNAYDVISGRSATDNNTLYLYTWLAF